MIGPGRAAREDRPRPGRMGLRLMVLCLAIGLAAINTGNNLLYLMLSLVLAMSIVSMAAARWSLRHLRVQPHLPSEARCGEPLIVGMEVHGRFPLLPQTWVQVRIDGLPRPVDLSVPVPAATGRGVASRHLTFDRRGVFDRLTISAATGYPLDLGLRRVRREGTAGLVILPRFRRIGSMRLAAAARDGSPASTARGAGGSGIDLRKIREHTPSDDARHIDWRSTARMRRLMVREFEPEAERRLDLVLDLESADAQAFEEVVERCASILDLARREKYDALLVVPGRAEPLAGHEAMRCLAGVERVPPSSLQGRLTEALRRSRRGAELVVLSADPSRATPLELA